MSVSNSRNSDTIQIEALTATSVSLANGNIHTVTGTIVFNANVDLSTGITAKIEDISGLEEDLVLTLNASTNILDYEFSYNTANPNIQILTPRASNDTIIPPPNKIIITYNSNTIGTYAIDVDSCKKYFDNVNSGGTFAFALPVYDFSSNMSFNLVSYIADSDDKIKMYSKGVASENGIRKAFTTLNATPSGSTPILNYNSLISSDISGLTPHTYDLSSNDDIIIEIEKDNVLYTTPNNKFNITNALSSQDITVYMDDYYNDNPITYSSSGEVHTVVYTLFNPVWKDILSANEIIQPSVVFTSTDIPTLNINDIITSTSSNINNGSITITVVYTVNNSTVGQSTTPGDTVFFNASISISIGAGFSMSTPSIQFSSVVTV